jgi:Ca2+-binding RTX toxin-like protein
VEIGNATLAGAPLNLGGSTVQVDDSYKGSVIANFSRSIVEGTVDKSTNTGVGSIADNAPSNAGNFNFYINTGAGDDRIEGTIGNDFIRAGAGNDVVFGGAGDDVVRVGAGNDTMYLGKGNDVLYLTVDQLQGQSTNTITDFDGTDLGDDKIQIDADLVGRVSISGQGTNQIVITLSGSQTGVTTIVSQAGTIDNDDIQFV